LVKNRGRELEDVIVKLLSARPHKNSGAMAEKFDANTDFHVLEIKTTKADSWKLDKPYWKQLCDDAIMHSKEPALILAWDEQKGELEENDVCVIISLSSFMAYEEMMDGDDRK
jgi:hypothetical protein